MTGVSLGDGEEWSVGGVSHTSLSNHYLAALTVVDATRFLDYDHLTPGRDESLLAATAYLASRVFRAEVNGDLTLTDRSDGTGTFLVGRGGARQPAAELRPGGASWRSLNPDEWLDAAGAYVGLVTYCRPPELDPLHPLTDRLRFTDASSLDSEE